MPKEKKAIEEKPTDGDCFELSGYEEGHPECEKPCLDKELCADSWKTGAFVDPRKKLKGVAVKEATKPVSLLTEIEKATSNAKVDMFEEFYSKVLGKLMGHIDKKFEELGQDILCALGAADPEKRKTEEYHPSPKAELPTPTLRKENIDEMDVTPEAKDKEPFSPPPDDEEPEPVFEKPPQKRERAARKEKVSEKTREEEQEEILGYKSKVPDEIFKPTLAEMIAFFAYDWKNGIDVSVEGAKEPEIVSGPGIFKLFQEDTAHYQLGKNRKPLGVIRIVAERIYGVSQTKTFSLIDVEFCNRLGLPLTE